MSIMQFIDRASPPLPLDPAITYLGNEPEGMAVEFCAMRMFVRDRTTAGNNFLGDPNGKLTYASPSSKLITNGLGVLEAGTTLRCDHDPATLDTSATSQHSLGIGTNKTFATSGAVTYVAGQDVRLTSAADITKWMLGRVVSYAGGSLVVTIYAASGYFSTASWKVIVALGILIEEQRTNLLINSVFANSGGAAPTSYSQPFATGTSVPVASTIGAPGSAYSQTAAAQRPVLASSASFTWAASTSYALSINVEAVSGGLGAQDLLRFTSMPAGATVSYPACPANPSGTPGGALTVGRLVASLTVAATAGSSQVYVGIGCNGTATGSVTFSAPQLEAGNSPTSYIPTTATQVTRASDNISLVGSSIPYNVSAGTLLASLVRPSTQNTVSGGYYATPMTLSGPGGYPNAILLTLSGANLQSYVGNQSVTNGGALVANKTLKAGVAYDAASFIGAAGGSLSASGSSPAAPASVSNLLFGRANTAHGYLYGWLKSVVYLPRKLSNGELQARTT